MFAAFPQHWLRFALALVSISLSPSPLRAECTADQPVERLLRAVPAEVDHCTPERLAEFTGAVDELEQWTADLAWRGSTEPDQAVKTIEVLLHVKARTATALDQCLTLRTRFVDASHTPAGRAGIRSFLQICGRLVDLLGRLRYTLRDAIDNATYALEENPTEIDRLIDVLIASRDASGAAVLSYVLFDPLPEEGQPFSDTTKRKVLALIAAARSEGSVKTLADFLRDPSTSASLRVEAAGVLRQIGLPQHAIPEETVTDAPAMTAAELLSLFDDIDQRQLSEAQQQQYSELVAWLRERSDRGTVEAGLRIGNIEVLPGDWILQRNPSPYNRFTDISPGLFTHLAIVTEHADDQGRRRIVAVDMPERGAYIPATNVETFLERSLHYLVLRPTDSEIAWRLAATAAETIGNEAQFDLQFRTDRMPVSAGESLRYRRIHGYCAGFLLTCAQASGYRREMFFPIEEAPASDQCQTNLKKLGLSLGDRFVSPTGPLFSSQFQIVGQREPSYDPGREIKEAVYDHFAESMAQRELRPSPNLFQSLRVQAAQLSRTNPWLARALAQANGVSPEMDLASAAKAAAVIETLDSIADDCWHTFELARAAVMAGADEEFRKIDVTPEQRVAYSKLRKEHAELLEQWLAGNLSPRELRLQLVAYYAGEGRRRIDERFFTR